MSARMSVLMTTCGGSVRFAAIAARGRRRGRPAGLGAGDGSYSPEIYLYAKIFERQEMPFERL